MATIDLTDYDSAGNAVLWSQAPDHMNGSANYEKEHGEEPESPEASSAQPESPVLTDSQPPYVTSACPEPTSREKQDLIHSKLSRRIVVCGSMSAYSVMAQMEDQLRQHDVLTAIPNSEDHVKPLLAAESWEVFKRNVSMGHIRRVRDPRTFAILVINLDKYGVSNYIGANTFAEVAIAFAQGKKIYLLCDIPELYMDELRAWGVISLRGDIGQLVSDYRESCHQEKQQLSLFENDEIK